MNGTDLPRKRQTTLSSSLVRIVCVSLVFVTFGAALLGLGLTCSLLGEIDKVSAPCPNRLTIGAFGAAGGLVLVSFVLFIIVCKKKRRLRKEALLEDLPQVCAGKGFKKLDGAPPLESSAVGLSTTTEARENGADDNFEMTQKSADVSYWIEQQKSEVSSPSDNYQLSPVDGTTSHLSDAQDSEGEMTAL